MFVLQELILLGLSMVMMPASSEWADPMLMTDSGKPLKKCQYYRENSMLAATCVNLNLEEIPSNLKSDLEILDFSHNRLVDINKDTFSKFSSLKYLDLKNNFLRPEDDAFEALQELVALDLSKTRPVPLPKSLYTLPNLENLYLETNKLTDSAFDMEFTSPLITFQASYNSFTKLPHLGSIPTLQVLNFSANSIKQISVNDIAVFCRLKTLDLSKNPISFSSSNCDCQDFRNWADQHDIHVRPASILDCFGKSRTDCPNEFSNRTMSLFQNCEKGYKTMIDVKKAKTTKIVVISCIVGTLLCIGLALYCIHKRNQKRHRKLKKEQQLATNNANNANTELLNSNLKEQS